MPNRIRMRWRKVGRVRFISHLDEIRVWERTLRRARVPLAFTSGFSPRPKLHFGPALPTCFESNAEYLEFEVADVIDLASLGETLNALLPDGMSVLAVEAAPEGAASLQADIAFGEYLVPLLGHVDDLDAAVAAVLAAESLPLTIMKKQKPVDVDVRPGIDALVALDLRDGVPPALPPRVDATIVDGWIGRQALWCRLATRPRSVRPGEVVAHLPGTVTELLSHRSAQVACGPDGRLAEPIPLSRLEPIHGAFCQENQTPSQAASGGEW